MSDSATLNHAARILAQVSPSTPADQAMRRYMADARRLGPREKRAVSRAVFAYFRWWRWLDEKASLQKQVEQAAALQTRFTENEKSVKTETLAARAVPDWSRDELAWTPETLRQLQREPTLWLRARPGTAGALAATLGASDVISAVSLAPGNPPVALAGLSALRYRGEQDLFLTPAFHAGAFEIQDLSSQLVGQACDPQPGETWWDACAGEGGKLLHLSDLMQNKGLIWASDRSERRLHQLKKRAARAKAFNFRTALWDGSARLPTKSKFDGILLDAPCSGVGTWQRNPHARWTTQVRDVAELAAIQVAMLNHVASAVKPGGKLVYAVCTLTRRETTEIAEAFSAAHADFESQPVLGTPGPLTLWPDALRANGMFIAAWRRKQA